MPTWLSRLRASLRELSDPACPRCASIDVDPVPADLLAGMAPGTRWCRCRTCGHEWAQEPPELKAARVELAPSPPASLYRLAWLVLLLAVLGTVALTQVESCTQQGQPQPFDMRRPQ